MVLYLLAGFLIHFSIQQGQGSAVDFQDNFTPDDEDQLDELRRVERKFSITNTKLLRESKSKNDLPFTEDSDELKFVTFSLNSTKLSTTSTTSAPNGRSVSVSGTPEILNSTSSSEENVTLESSSSEDDKTNLTVQASKFLFSKRVNKAVEVEEGSNFVRFIDSDASNIQIRSDEKNPKGRNLITEAPARSDRFDVPPKQLQQWKKAS